MESLPPEMVAKVAQYLTLRELNACCGVSLHWRQAFNNDWVWKRWCDPDLEEYLRTTPCLVEPAFSVPGEQDSTLTPLCRWRTAFLREQWLRTNWRIGRSTETLVDKFEKDSGSVLWELFVSNDIVIGFYPDSVELWDVRMNPPVCVDRLATDRQSTCLCCEPQVGENGLVIAKSHNEYDIRVFKVNFIDSTLIKKYVISLDEIINLPIFVSDDSESSDSSELSVVEPLFLKSFRVVITSGTNFFGYFDLCEGYNLFYVCDFESGMKLKEEACPLDSLFSMLTIVGPYRGCKSCPDMLVLFYSLSSDNLIVCRVYDGQELKFLSFERTLRYGWEVQARCTNDCAIINNFVVLPEALDGLSNDLNIFNYRTQQKLFTLTKARFVQGIDDSCFVYSITHLYPEFKLFSVDCHTGEVVNKVSPNPKFYVSGNKFILFKNPKPQIWRINNLSAFKFDYLKPREINKYGTRVILETRFCLAIAHYW